MTLLSKGFLDPVGVAINEYILLMVQKSGLDQLRLIIYPHYLQVFVHHRWLFGIAELSTVVRRFREETIPTPT